MALTRMGPSSNSQLYVLVGSLVCAVPGPSIPKQQLAIQSSKTSVSLQKIMGQQLRGMCSHILFIAQVSTRHYCTIGTILGPLKVQFKSIPQHHHNTIEHDAMLYNAALKQPCKATQYIYLSFYYCINPVYPHIYIYIHISELH